MRYARADDGSPRILDFDDAARRRLPVPQGCRLPRLLVPEVQVTFRDLTDLARRRTA